VSDTEVGQGGTTQWRLCSLDFDTAVALYFDITASAKWAARAQPPPPPPLGCCCSCAGLAAGSGCLQLQQQQLLSRASVQQPGAAPCCLTCPRAPPPPLLPCRDQQDAAQQAQSNQQFYLQFVTKYLHWSGELRCRVTTITRRWTAAGAGDLIQVRRVLLGLLGGRPWPPPPRCLALRQQLLPFPSLPLAPAAAPSCASAPVLQPSCAPCQLAASTPALRGDSAA
jgi:hypothetical protein